MTPVSIGAAIRRAYEGRTTQAKLAEQLSVDQGTISKWANDKARPSIEEIATIEDLCDRQRGFILRAAGYVVEVATVAELVATDPDLDDPHRDAVLAVYDRFISQG